MKIPTTLLAVATVAHVGIYIFAAPEHVADATWPPHARFHVLQAIFWVAGLDAVLLPIILFPFRKGERWAFWTLALAWPLAHGSYFIALLMLGPEFGPPETFAHVVMASVLILYGTGLVWGRISSA